MLEIFFVDIDCKRRVGWIVYCLRSGLESWIMRKFVREGKKIVFIVDNCLVYLYIEGFDII